jgi:hypothetical protein
MEKYLKLNKKFAHDKLQYEIEKDTLDKWIKKLANGDERKT